MPAGDDFLRATLPALDLVHNLARRLVPGRADAEDLVQETYLRAWQAWTAGRPPRRVEPWLATICLNLGRDRARRAATRLEVAVEALDDLPDATDVEAEAIAHTRRAQVQRALWALPEPQRVAVTLMDLGGFTAAEPWPSRCASWPRSGCGSESGRPSRSRPQTIAPGRTGPA